jgi:NTE family protein
MNKPRFDATNMNDQQHRSSGGKRIGLALGGGGAVGLAHIAMLEVFDELEVRPFRMAGTSIGAIIGALYASGMSSAEIKRIVMDLVARDQASWKGRLFDRRLLQWIRFMDPELGEGGLVGGDAFISFLKDTLKVTTFEELSIPLKVVATDYWERKEVVYESGDLLKPIQASMAVPGLFRPVRMDDRVLVDGGLTNPVPYDVLSESCDLVVAVDVTGGAKRREDISFMDAVHMAGRILLHRVMEEKMTRIKPDIYIAPQVLDVHVLQFHKFDRIYEQALPAAETLRRELRNHI